MNFSDIPTLIGLSLKKPELAARGVLNVGLDRNNLWLALAFVAVASVILTHLTFMMLGITQNAALPTSPFALALVLWGGLVLIVFCTHYLGRAFGGTGEMEASLTSVVWVQVVMLALQVVQMALFLVSPLFAQLFGIGSAMLGMWIFMHFIKEVHGFTSLGNVFVGAIVSMIGVVIGLSILLSIIAAILGWEIQNV